MSERGTEEKTVLSSFPQLLPVDVSEVVLYPAEILDQNGREGCMFECPAQPVKLRQAADMRSVRAGDARLAKLHMSFDFLRRPRLGPKSSYFVKNELNVTTSEPL